MSLSKTVRGWSKELGRAGKEPSGADRIKGRMARPARKNREMVRKMAAKIKKEGYPNRFISEKEQETRD